MMEGRKTKGREFDEDGKKNETKTKWKKIMEERKRKGKK